MNQMLEDDVRALKERVADTQLLYREVCALLFFRYGETPTANKLYQLVRRGSMSAPAKALRDFWGDVRDRSRIDIGQPDLPPEVAKAAGELVATLWRSANSAADESMEAIRLEVQQEIDIARAAAESAGQARQAAVDERDALRTKLDSNQRHLADLEASNAEHRAAISALREQLHASRSECDAARAALVEARQDFSSELEKLRTVVAQSEQRFIAVEKRALMEIERERMHAVRAKEESQRLVERANTAEATHKTEVAALQAEIAKLNGALADAQSRAGYATEQLTVREAAFAQQTHALHALQARLDELHSLSDAPRHPSPLPRLARASQPEKDRKNVNLVTYVFRRRAGN